MPGDAADYTLMVDGITKRFGGLLALGGLSFNVKRGSVHALIGPNGSGKTTFFNVITGVLPSDAGTCTVDGIDASRSMCHEIARLGVSRTFQSPALFGTMSVLDNVMVGCQCCLNPSVGGAIVGKGEEASLVDQAMEAIEFVGLRASPHDMATSLPYGAQRLLEIARALATKPRLLLLDEPAAGMNPEETNYLAGLVRRARDELGITILLIEHNMGMVMNLADRITCIDYGKKIAEGPPSVVARDPGVVKAYLGEEGLRRRRERSKSPDAGRDSHA